MRSILMPTVGTGLSVALMVLGLWGWQNAGEFSTGASQPYIATLAARSAAIAITAIAQIVLLTLVVGRLYRRQLIDDVLKLSAALVLAVAVVSAVALGLAAR